MGFFNAGSFNGGFFKSGFDLAALSQTLNLWITNRFQNSTSGKTANNFNSVGGFAGTDDAYFTADTDWTACFWVNFNALGGVLMGKWDWGASKMVWEVRDVTSQLRFIYTNSSGTQFNLDDAAAISTGTWYFVAVGYDSVNNQVFIKRNNSALVTASLSGGLDDINSPLSIGMELNGGTVSNACNAIMDGIGFWTRTLTNAELDAIYNSGSGTAYSALSAAQKVNMWAWYECNDDTGVLVDHYSTNDLARLDFGTRADQVDGKVIGDVNADEPVYRFNDMSASNNDGTQATFANRALLKTAYNSSANPSAQFDGTNDSYDLGSAIAFTGDFTVFAVASCSDYAATRVLFGHGTLAYVANTSTTNFRLRNDAGTLLNVAHSAWDTNPHVITIQRSGSTVTVYQDGTSAGSGTLSGTMTFNKIGIAGGSPWIGNIAELLTYSGALTAGERNATEKYLGAQYGITVA